MALKATLSVKDLLLEIFGLISDACSAHECQYWTDCCMVLLKMWNFPGKVKMQS